jgi:hypothetical protein
MITILLYRSRGSSALLIIKYRNIIEYNNLLYRGFFFVYKHTKVGYKHFLPIKMKK